MTRVLGTGASLLCIILQQLCASALPASLVPVCLCVRACVCVCVCARVRVRVRVRVRAYEVTHLLLVEPCHSLGAAVFWPQTRSEGEGERLREIQKWRDRPGQQYFEAFVWRFVHSEYVHSHSQSARRHTRAHARTHARTHTHRERERVGERERERESERERARRRETLAPVSTLQSALIRQSCEAW